MDISNRKKMEHPIEDISFTNSSELKNKFDEFNLVSNRKLQSPILGYHYELPDLPTSYVPSITLDTSLLHIPVYAHLQIYDLKPVQLPEIPSILSALRLQFSDDTVLNKSPREISSAQMSEEDKISALNSIRDNTKIAK